MTRIRLFMFHVCALAWTWVAPSERAWAQCGVDVATSLVFSKGEPVEGYGLALETVEEHTSGELAGFTTYRLYMETALESDRVIAAVGDNEFPLSLMPETPFTKTLSAATTQKESHQRGLTFSPMWPTTVGSRSAWTALLLPDKKGRPCFLNPLGKVCLAQAKGS